MTLTRRVLSVLAGAALMTAGLVGTGAPAQAAACSGTNGVTVVIQSSQGTSTRCASGDPGSAMSALQSVASVTQPSRMPGVVCRINGYPASDPCVNMPSGDAYWAFFHGPAGGSWTYSQSGASTYDPRPGSSIGFRFGSGAKPSVSPAAPAPAPKPTTAKPKPTSAAPRPTTAPPKTTAPRGTTPPTTDPTPGSTVRPTFSGTGKPSVNGSPTFSESPRPDASSPGPESASSTPSTSPTASDTVGAQKPPDTGSGSSGRLVGGGILLLALATAVGAVALRRRQAAAAATAATDVRAP